MVTKNFISAHSESLEVAGNVYPIDEALNRRNPMRSSGIRRGQPDNCERREQKNNLADAPTTRLRFIRLNEAKTALTLSMRRKLQYRIS